MWAENQRGPVSMGLKPMVSYHLWALLQTFRQLSIISCCLQLRLCAASGLPS